MAKTKKLTNETKKKMIEWYLQEDERTCLDLAFEFNVSSGLAGKIIKEAGVGKSPYRNKTKNRPAAKESDKPSGQPSIQRVSNKAAFRGHRRRGSY